MEKERGGCWNKSGGRWPSSRTWETHKKIIKEGLEPLNFPTEKTPKNNKNSVGLFSQLGVFTPIVWAISS
jgi:hypothetical protein